MNKKIKLVSESSKETITFTVPEIDDDEIIPRIKIYDCQNDGSYWFRRIGFNRKITDLDK